MPTICPRSLISVAAPSRSPRIGRQLADLVASARIVDDRFESEHLRAACTCDRACASRPSRRFFRYRSRRPRIRYCRRGSGVARMCPRCQAKPRQMCPLGGCGKKALAHDQISPSCCGALGFGDAANQAVVVLDRPLDGAVRARRACQDRWVRRHFARARREDRGSKRRTKGR